jgi:multidrug efflux pump subunit AcrB
MLLGVTPQHMTNCALALAVGNFSVMTNRGEVEHMTAAHARMRHNAASAAFDSSRSWFAALVLADVAALRLCRVSCQLLIMGGIPGQFFQPFGVTVAVSTIFSTLVARTITPMLGAYFSSQRVVRGSITRMDTFQDGGFSLIVKC